MKFTSFASSSKGNCHLLEIGGETLLLDAGLSRKQIVRAGVKLSELSGCLITHSH